MFCGSAKLYVNKIIEARNLPQIGLTKATPPSHPFFVSLNLGLTYGTNAKGLGVVVRILGWVVIVAVTNELAIEDLFIAISISKG